MMPLSAESMVLKRLHVLLKSLLAQNRMLCMPKRLLLPVLPLLCRQSNKVGPENLGVDRQGAYEPHLARSIEQLSRQKQLKKLKSYPLRASIP